MKKRTLKSIFLKNNVDIEIPENIYFDRFEKNVEKMEISVFLISESEVLEDVKNLIKNKLFEQFSSVKEINLNFQIINEEKNLETNIRRFLTNQFFPYKLTENKYFVEISEKNVKLTLPSKTLLERFYEENMSEKLSKRFSIVEKWDFSYSEEIDKEDFFRNQEENEKEILKVKMEENLSKIQYNNVENFENSDEFHIGREIKLKPVKIDELNGNSQNSCIEGEIFDIEIRNTREENKKILIFYLEDETGAILCKMFLSDKDGEKFSSNLKDGSYVLFEGKFQYDNYSKCDCILGNKIRLSQKIEKIDDYPEKRVELHLFSVMSNMDSLIDIQVLGEKLKKWGHKYIGITDSGAVQAYPDLMKFQSDFGIKPLYGVDMRYLNPEIPILRDVQAVNNFDDFVVFDIETTGFSRFNDNITEIGAVRVSNGQIKEIYNTLVNPEMNIPEEVVKLTGITNAMVKKERKISEVMPEFLNFVGNSTLVAHNAEFDVGFIKYKCKDLGIDFKRAYLDTLWMARAIHPDKSKFALSTLCTLYKIKLEDHHRAWCDAKATAELFLEFQKKLQTENIKIDENINNMKSDLQKGKNQSFNMTCYVKNMKGLRNLYEMVSVASMEYFNISPGFTEEMLKKYREGLIYGSGNPGGLLFQRILRGDSDEKLFDIARKFDFLEIQPPSACANVLERGSYKDSAHLEECIKKVIRIGEELKIPVIAAGNVKYFEKEDYVYRNTVVRALPQKRFGYGEGLENQGNFFLRTTREMLDEFIFLGEEKAKEAVIYNPIKIAESIEDIKPIPDGTFPPFLENAEDELKTSTYNKAHNIYGENLPEIVEKRLKKELDSIIKNGYSVLYVIAKRLVNKSNEDGYLVGSRGSVGSSFVATMSGITEVNPLKPHYICEKCRHSEFISDGSYSSGLDLPDKMCPDCNINMKKDGHDIPFEVFLGFDGDKEPDIDLNFAGEYQSEAHKYTEKMFGDSKIFRAGTIGTIQDNTALSLVGKFFEQEQRKLSEKSYYKSPVKRFDFANMKKFQKKIVGVKRTTGQHPGGIMIVPNDKSIFDFTPIQYPADDASSGVKTTHFNYKVLSGKILKLDLLGHDVPSIIKELSNLTGVDAVKIPLDDKKTMEIFSSVSSLNMIEDFGEEIGTLGIPEFGTSFVRQMLRETKPKTFAELVRISGLSHGENVWLNNAQDLVKSGKAKLKDIISTRDDIMTYLILMGLENKKAFKIMETVRKGKSLDEDTVSYMKTFDLPDWYIDSCEKINYLFPKAHAVAYVLMSYRIAYFKVHFKEAFYASYFDTKKDSYLGSVIYNGLDAIKAKIEEIKSKENKTAKDESNLNVLEVAEEMCCRGAKVARVDLYKSHGNKFLITEDNFILPPFCALENVSEATSMEIFNEAKKSPFLSIEDLKNRTGANKNAIDALLNHGVLEGMSENNQLSIFGLM